MLTLYGDRDSGNSYKVELVLTQLGKPHRYVVIDTLKGETRTAEFLAKNPNGRVPVLEIDDGTYLPESNAILCYLAEGSALMPTDRLERAQVLQWLFFEQYNHEPNIATARHWLRAGLLTPEREYAFAQKRLAGYAALGVMEDHLERHRFFVGERYSIADICLYAYTHVAGQGDFDLARFPAVEAWLDRVRSQPGHVSMLKD